MTQGDMQMELGLFIIIIFLINGLLLLDINK